MRGIPQCEVVMMSMSMSSICRTIRKNISSYLNRNYSIKCTIVPTIYAKSSGHGKCGVAVIRVSGPQSRTALSAMLKHATRPSVSEKIFKNQRQTFVRKLYDPVTNDELDAALVIWFKGPMSFTGDDSCELHVHGGPAVVSAVLSALGKVPGLRPAKPGEFTKRAFFNNKLDLTEVEGLGDLIHAETEAQRKQAIREMDGVLTKLFSTWRSRLIKCLANVEAWIDFSEDENIEEGIIHHVLIEVRNIIEELDNHLKDCRRGERLRSGVHATIVGKPNVGKSSLLNIICQRPVSIVSHIAGTTRDVIESAFDIGGYPVLFTDTAGLRYETADVIEEEGVRRARARLEQADLAVVMLDALECRENLKCNSFSDRIICEQCSELHLPSWMLEGLTDWDCNKSTSYVHTIINKCDLLPEKDYETARKNLSEGISLVSCKTGDGIQNMLEKLKSKVENLCGDPSVETGSLMRERHKLHLEKSKEHLLQFLECYENDVVIGARKLHLAVNELGKISGEVRNEDILDVIFKDFCIGK